MIVEPAEQLVTVFGGGGFVGRYVCEILLKRSVRVRVACREPRLAHFIQPLGQVGQFGSVRADVTNRASVERAVYGATSVINLVGILKGKFTATHVDGARALTEAAAAAGAGSLVHISAIGADTASESAYGRSKGEGEAAVRAAFPGATLIRPSIVFGPEDDFVNRFAGMARLLPLLPVIRGQWRVQPVYAADLGKAIAAAALDPGAHGGKTYELAGPQILSMTEVNRWICQTTGHGAKAVVEIPDAIGGLIARLGFLPGSPITWDQWLMLSHDNVASGELPGFEAFDIQPAPLAAVAETWLPLYRRRGRWADRRRENPPSSRN